VIRKINFGAAARTAAGPLATRLACRVDGASVKIFVS